MDLFDEAIFEEDLFDVVVPEVPVSRIGALMSNRSRPEDYTRYLYLNSLWEYLEWKLKDAGT
jgi:hypothetical protein